MSENRELDHRSVAGCLCELGHPTRLQIYRSLVQASPEGLAVQEIQQRLDVPASTLSHHISRLVGVNLLEQVREGRVLRCYAVATSLQSVLDYLAAECCCTEPCSGTADQDDAEADLAVQGEPR